MHYYCDLEANLSPIVTAQIVTKHSLQHGFAYSIHVYNTGTRPAVDIKLSASVSDIQKINS